MPARNLILRCVAGAALTFALLGPAAAQGSRTVEEVTDVIIEEVIRQTAEAAREEVRRNTGIDPMQRGYDRGKRYEPVRGNSDETRRELAKLNEEHDREIGKLEQELQRKLEKAEAEFEREASKEDKPEKVEEKRGKLEEKVDAAFATFEEKIGEENARYDEKRDRILAKRRGG
jgi:hypothetical protein